MCESRPLTPIDCGPPRSALPPGMSKELNPLSRQLADHPMTPVTMYRLVQSYLEALPGTMKEAALPGGARAEYCVYTPHSLRVHHRHPSARRWRGHPQGPGPPRPPPYHYHPDLRHPPAVHSRGRQPFIGDLTATALAAAATLLGSPTCSQPHGHQREGPARLPGQGPGSVSKGMAGA
jgi:hypothetical protein